MEFEENKYYDSVMGKYLIILIEMPLYQYRCNKIFIEQFDRKDRAIGIYEAMNEMADIGEKIICVNFEVGFSVQQSENLHYISGKNTYYLSPLPCDYLFVYNRLPQADLDKIIDYYNPKFIYYC